MVFGCWTVSATMFLAVLVYFAFFWKMNWIRDLRKGDGKRSWLKGRLIGGGSRNATTNRTRKVGRLPPVYPNGWFALAESCDLKNGQVKHVSALGQNFAVFRSEKGTVNVLDAYCPHLGANMGEGGKVRGDCLECPFHGWLFRGNDGRCQNIPYSEKVPEFAKTKAWDCCEVNQMIFVWHHAENIPPNWRPQPLKEISNGNWRYQGRNEFLVNSHIQEIPENGADWAHLSTVHGPSMLLSETFPWLARHEWSQAEWKPHSSRKKQSEEVTNDVKIIGEDTVSPSDETWSIEREEESSSHRATARLRHALILLERITVLTLDVRAEQIGPAYVELLIQSSMGPMCILQTVTPLEPLLQRVTHLIFAPTFLAPVATIFLIGESKMFERDVAVWNHKRFEQKPLLVKEDQTILAYRRWYAQFYSANSPTYESEMRSLQW